MAREFRGRDYAVKMYGNGAEIAREVARGKIVKEKPDQKALDYFHSKPFYFQQKERRKEDGAKM